MAQTEYLIIVEKYGTGAYGAYVAELPGIGVAGKTEDEVHELIADAIRLYLEGHDRECDRAKDPVVVNHYTITI